MSIKVYAGVARKFIVQTIIGLFCVFAAASAAQAQDVDYVIQLEDTFPIPPDTVSTSFDQIPAGGTARMLIVVENQGGAQSPPTTVSFPLPGAATFTGQENNGITSCVEASGTVTCQVPALNPTERATVIVDLLSSIQERWEITGTVLTQTGESASARGNNTETQDFDIIAGADLGVEWITPSSVVSGSFFDYTIRVTNNGPDTAADYVVEVPIPNGVVNVTPPSGPWGSCTLSTNYICTITADLPNAGTLDLTFEGQAAVSDNSDITGSGTVRNVNPIDPISNNDTRSFNVAVTPGADAAITKARTPGGGVLLVDDSVTFTLTPRVFGVVPDVVIVEDILPPQYAFDSVSPAQCLRPNEVAEPQRVVCTFPAASGTTNGGVTTYPTVSIQATVAESSPDPVQNEASITISAELTDPNDANNSDSDTAVSLQDPVPDLAAFKEQPDPALTVVNDPDDTYDFTVYAENIGNAGYVGTVTITDLVPVELSVVGILSPAGWACSVAGSPVTPSRTVPIEGPASIDCVINYGSGSPLAAGAETSRITFQTVAVAEGTDIRNTISIDAPGDGDGSNNTAFVEFDARFDTASADVSTVKQAGFLDDFNSPAPATFTADTMNARVGEPYAFRIEIQNSGPAAAEDVRVIDVFEDVLNSNQPFEAVLFENISSTPSCSQARVDARDRRLTCDIGTVPANCTAGVGGTCPAITVVVLPGRDATSRTNTATSVSLATPDPDLDNNDGSVTYDMTPQVDVAVSKTADTTIGQGRDLVYSLAARNLRGYSTASAVQITDSLPAGLRFKSISPGSGVTCSTSLVANQVTTGGPGELITCEMGSLNQNQQRTVQIVVEPTSSLMNDFTNTANVTTTSTDINADNDQDLVTTSVTDPAIDLSIEKNDTPDPLIVGESFVYRLRIDNRGPSAAENIVVTDTWPQTLGENGDPIVSYANTFRFQDSSSNVVSGAGIECVASGGTSGSPSQIECTYPYLDASDYFFIDLDATGTAKGNVLNTVIVASDETEAGFEETFGPGTNNDDSERTTVTTLTDVRIESKTAAPNPTNVRDAFDYVAVISVNTDSAIDNFASLQEADGVVFSDELPVGMELTGTPVARIGRNVTTGATLPVGTCTGSAGDTSFTCSFGTIDSGEGRTVVIPVTVPVVTSEPQSFTNTATVATTSTERGNARNNNSGDGAVDVNSSTISGNVFRDFADDEDKQPGDTDVSDVPITLTGTVDGVQITPVTINTDANGNFLFQYLAEGTYTVTRGEIPVVYDDEYLSDGTNTAGNVDTVNSGTVNGNAIENILLGDNEDHEDNIFRLIPEARIGLAKDGMITVQNDDGTFDATFTLEIENFSLETLIDISVTDILTDGSDSFGTLNQTGPLANGDYRILTAPNGSCSGAGSLNSGYNGDTDAVIASGISLSPLETCQVSFAVRVYPTLERVAGPFVNQALVSGTGDLSRETASDTSDDGTEPDSDGDGIADEAGENDPTVVSPSTTPGISLIKAGVLSGTAPIEDGDLVTYNFTVRNDGEVTLTDIEIRDPMIQAQRGETAPFDPLFTIPFLAPSAQETVSTDYELTQEDLDNSEVVNTANVIGTDPFGRQPTDDSGTAFDNDDATTTLLTPQPELEVVKTADASGIQNPTVVGDPIIYTFVVTNTGNVTLTDVRLTDPLSGLEFDPANNNPISVLEPGEGGAVTMTATYAVTIDDIQAGQVLNQASVTGVDPDENPVSDASEEVIVPLFRNPAIETVKSQLPVDNGDGIDGLGDTINYTITVTNTGTVPLTNVSLVDTLTDLNSGPLTLSREPTFVSADAGSSEGDLQVGETATYEAAYLIESGALAAGGVSNTVTASGDGPSGSGPAPSIVTVSDVSDDDIDTDGNTTDDPTETLLSPSLAVEGLSMSKTTPLVLVDRGDVVPYTITILNENPFFAGLYELTDTLPEGLIYIPGTATIDGVAASVTFTAGQITWTDIEVPALDDLVLTLEARVLNGARSGDLVNVATLRDADTGDRALPDATATVRIEPEGVFECADIVGKVFNDVNGNGYQDAPETIGRAAITDQDIFEGKGKLSPVAIDPDETGLPGVRLATVDGTVITTDENGLFSVPCADLPATGGSNFILKVDERSLPAGYRMTTENPRVTRVSPGAMTEMNFGAAASLPVVRVDLSDASFVQTDEGEAMVAGLQAGLLDVMLQVAGTPSNMVITFHLPVTADRQDIRRARALMDIVEGFVRDEWRDIGQVRLRIEQTILRASQ